MLGAARVHHVAIIARDIERSLEFYELLDFVVLNDEYRASRDSRKIDLGLPSGDRIELFSFPGSPPRSSYPEAAGLRHLAFEVDDLDGALRHAHRLGIQCEPSRIDGATGRRFTFFQDPDGLPIELYEGERHPMQGVGLDQFVAAPFGPLVRSASPAWAPLVDTAALVVDAQSTLPAGFSFRGDGIAVHEGATVHRAAELVAPVIIGDGCRVAGGALLRGGVVLVRDVIVGPGTEIVRSFVHGGSVLAHFNFVGDSIIGSNVNLEAGAVIANHFNERRDKRITVNVAGRDVATGLTKFGAVVGDDARIGANSVVGPGALLAPAAIVPRLTRHATTA